MEGFREIWVSPKRLAEKLSPTAQDDELLGAWGGAEATSLPVRNSRSARATVSVNGIDIGVVDGLTSAAVHGLAPGLYELQARWPGGYEESRLVATRALTAPLAPGSAAAAAAFETAPPPGWSAQPTLGYAEPVPPAPAEPPPRISLRVARIELNERIQFDLGSAQIDARSHGLLDELAGLLRAHPELQLVEVQGHTDASGEPEANLRLSEARAQAVVRYLSTSGVEEARLRAVGFGSTRPLDGAEVAESGTGGASRARRVELHVIERAPADAPPRSPDE